MGGTILRGAACALLGAALLFPATSSAARVPPPKRQTVPKPVGTPRVPTRLPAAATEKARGSPAAPAPEGYADSLEALSPAASSFERGGPGYVFCLRVVAQYEVVHYGAAGVLRHAFVRAEQHGTGFVFRSEGGESWLATNDHLVDLPAVVGAAPVDGVPAGARRVRESIFIVRGEDDDWTPGFIPLERVFADPATDVAVLKARRSLPAMPYRVGRSADLKVGDVVLSRGYPLGAFASANVGRVTAVGQDDTESVWDHEDFVVDAALNNGNSGSPVLAISRRTHEPELVGIFHARYRDATGMGVVVGIDQVREALATLSPPSRPAAADERAEAMRLLSELGRATFFPFGGLTARATPVEEGVRFEVFDDFPASEASQVALTSGPKGTTVELAALASEPVDPAAEASLRAPSEELERELWRSLANSLALRRAREEDDGSAIAHRRIALLRRELARGASDQKEILSSLDYEGQRLSAVAPEARARPAPAGR